MKKNLCDELEWYGLWPFAMFLFAGLGVVPYYYFYLTGQWHSTLLSLGVVTFGTLCSLGLFIWKDVRAIREQVTKG